MNPATIDSQWRGKRVAFLGDSITDAIHVGTSKNYWQYLEDLLGIQPLVFGINGQQWKDIPDQVRKLLAQHGDTVDAIMVLMGTNDYNHGIPLGEWWRIETQEASYNGTILRMPRRQLLLDEGTLKGRINIALSLLKESFPDQQIILMTPIHRGFAAFGPENIQPEESFPNPIGLHLEAYADVIKEAGGIWALPVIDLYALCGLYPLTPAHHKYFHLADTDLLHPADPGHRRMALTIAYQLLALPPDFK